MTGNRGNKCIGIVKEVYNKWERRAPLCPEHVKQLTSKGVKVLLQPSNARIFTNKEYEEAGATITEDLSSASVILGVKQVPIENLLPKKTYLFFGHTIKAQPENMELLDALLDKKINMIDYECITENGQRGGKRLIAFGEYAGRAGMIDSCRGIGERLLNRGYSTPFLNVGSSYMYPTLDAAKEAVEYAGKLIEKNGIASTLAPMVFTFTGNGNVSKGAQEIFQLLPHTMVDPKDLSSLPVDRHRIYGCVVSDGFMVESRDGKTTNIDKEEYYNHPGRFVSTFHKHVIPYTSLLMNCTYWDQRYPRLLKKIHMKELYEKNNRKLIGVGDISCDLRGSVEFLEHSTTIESPFYLYDVMNDQVQSDLDGDGVMMLGVDILPSELPIESSQHFGNLLIDYIEPLLEFAAGKQLPLALNGALITQNGELRSSYEYIQKMRAERERNTTSSHHLNVADTCILLQGHIFDTRLINQALDLIEQAGGTFHLVDCYVRPGNQVSSAVIQISMNNSEELNKTISKLKTLAKKTENAKGTVELLPDYCKSDYTATRSQLEKQNTRQQVSVTSEDRKEYLCLGAGLVASPLVEYLSRDNKNKVTVVSAISNEAQALKEKIGRSNVSSHELDAISDLNKVAKLCGDSTCVISLLPATMHVPIAEQCILQGTPLVTASYISKEMKSLHDKAIHASIPILCEMGLDPGMDHMSAMKVIDEVKEKGGKIVSFSSVCGGLPAPEAADNPLGYKFSWSPRGVLTASQNAATYRLNGKVVHVPGDQLLNSSKNLRFLPSFALEQLPNRDSLPYADLYGIPDALSVFRGTLRYQGFSKIMYELQQLGLLSTASRSLPSTWEEFMNSTEVKGKSLSPETVECIKWLGMNSNEKLTNRNTLVDAFCDLLLKKLSYTPKERDMALMHHEFGISYENGTVERRTSTYVGYGKENGETIMAKTVGLTAAIGAELIVSGNIKQNGVLAPVTEDIYLPGLKKLEAEGIEFIEKIFKN